MQCSFCLKMAAHPPNRTNTYECSMCHELTTVKDADRVRARRRPAARAAGPLGSSRRPLGPLAPPAR